MLDALWPYMNFPASFRLCTGLLKTNYSLHLFMICFQVMYWCENVEVEKEEVLMKTIAEECFYLQIYSNNIEERILHTDHLSFYYFHNSWNSENSTFCSFNHCLKCFSFCVPIPLNKALHYRMIESTNKLFGSWRHISDL